VRHRGKIITLAAKHRLLAMYPYRFFAVEGGLMSYGTDMANQFRQAAFYIDRILKGEKPSALPVSAADQVRTSYQSRDRKNSWADIAHWFARPRRRGD
jgi:ABC-type uncharacterized transport system substrate-binding protein